MTEIVSAQPNLLHGAAQASTKVVITTPSMVGPQPKGIVQPTYDRSAIVPAIVHFGVGGFHRSHMALYVDDLLENRLCNWGIVGVGVKAPYDKMMRDALAEKDYRYTLVERDDHTCTMRVIGAITNMIYAPESPDAVFQQLMDPRTRIVSLTVTEGGYFTNPKGEFNASHPEIQHDLQNSNSPVTVFGYIVEALNRRKSQGLPPFTVLSCDNLQANGDVVRNATLSFAELHSAELRAWIEEHGRFPNTMVDRITPQTKEADKLYVKENGLGDSWPVVAEPFRQWVIEDKFCNGDRPPFELVGVQFTEDILPYELMKLRLLNASHSSLAYLGYLRGYTLVHEVVKDPLFEKFIKHLMANEVEALLPEVHGVDLKEYQKSLLQRFANSTLQDQVPRLCLDGSAKMPKFIAPSILEYSKRNNKALPSALTLAVAGWIRYLDGVDEQGKEIKILDPMTEELKGMTSREVLTHKAIFGDLADSEEFVETVLSLVEKLRDRGSLSVLKEVVDGFSA